jgi:hypothetical protein
MPRTLGILALLAVVLQAGAAGADCGAQMAQCQRNGMNFCGTAIGVVCPFQCCPSDWSGCCFVTDPQDPSRINPQCCPGPPSYSCDPDCKCVHPCSGNCCGANETCVTPPAPGSIGFCCPNSLLCGNECCNPPLVCTPDETCCVAGNECGAGCCSDGACCGGVCCRASEGKTCFDDGSVALCCPTTSPPCGGACCPPNQKCRRQHKPPDCKCKKKARGPKCGTFPCPKHPKRKCGGTRCCEGDQCIDGGCVPPLG